MKQRTFIRLLVWFLLAIFYFKLLIKASLEVNPYPSLIVLYIFSGLMFEFAMWATSSRRIHKAVELWEETSRLEVVHVHGLSAPKYTRVDLILLDQLTFWNPYGLRMDLEIKQIVYTSAITEQEFKLENRNGAAQEHSEKGYLCINYLDEQGDFKTIIVIVHLKEVADLIASQIRMHTVEQEEMGND
ncbi:hypothetical protein [Paenibacillus sp. KS-LC4]|uniref:hypothetical protein n=1 Tax=Paenibacillus sp. KS-LC4 TaxID=2979727 RepID=UPI0030D1728C